MRWFSKNQQLYVPSPDHPEAHIQILNIYIGLFGDGEKGGYLVTGKKRKKW